MLTEQTVVKQIALAFEQQVVHVQWAKQILKNNIVISESFSRKSYSRNDVEDFRKNIPNARLYEEALGWL